jgi:arylsulfatase A-like enzyme
LLAYAADAGKVLFAWLLLILAENVAVGVWQKTQFSAAWELSLARSLVTPIALGALLPCALVAALLGELASRAARPGAARLVWTLTGALSVAAVAYGVSTGRHTASWGVRGPFVLALGAAGAAAARWGVPWLARGSWDRRWAGPVGATAAIAFWCADVRILPRLYPAFHEGLFVLMLAAAATASLGWTGAGAPGGRGRGRAGVLLGVSMLIAGLACAVDIPSAAARLRRADNLRFILTEHAPLLGRAVRIASRLAPPPPLEDAAEGVVSTTKAEPTFEIPRALDWTGHDLLLVSVDALRADHVSAYGYGRPTTPSLDALAREGALFEEAYCPTPHTSYSITSMMTGKAMRPLLSLGLGRDSETWAVALRRYGFRTAAFYPPAVFFIDEDRFRDFETSGLGFEYRKVEFTTARRRVDQVAEYLRAATDGDGGAAPPLFLWVHLFEPHEPYEAHPEHPFGPLPIDAYDSEAAEADDAIGRIVALFRTARTARAGRPDPVIIVTADHGEEFGEHGGHYHGTSCYEEQVHVPLVVVGPGVEPGRIHAVVQTIDLLPTVLSALGIPRPARVRGRDLGSLMAGAGARASQAQGAADPGIAYAETDEYTLVARGDERLVCARKVAACSLFDVATDPGERHDRSAEDPATFTRLRAMTAANERDEGRYEAAGAEPVWPEALRRGLQGDVDAAQDVATLLDDASVAIRRKAAEVLFRLHPVTVAPSLRRALARDEDAEVRSWCALALVRMGEPAPAAAGAAAALLGDPARAWRRMAALAFAERGDARGAAELASWWAEEAPPRQGLDVESGKELLVAMARIRDAEAVPGLVASLAFVPLRPWIADALGGIGDARARGPLLAAFRDERSVTARPHEAAALVRLDARTELRAPLARFAGIEEPMPEAIVLAREAHLLRPESGGVALAEPAPAITATLVAPTGQPLRLLVLAASPGTGWTGAVAGRPVGAVEGDRASALHVVELGPSSTSSVAVSLHDPAGLLAAWVVARAPDVPPPAPVPYDAGTAGGAPDDAGRPEHLN